jgi:hypothetical protein
MTRDLALPNGAEELGDVAGDGAAKCGHGSPSGFVSTSGIELQCVDRFAEMRQLDAGGAATHHSADAPSGRVARY